jgi:hypothetical protein
MKSRLVRRQAALAGSSEQRNAERYGLITREEAV